MLQITYPIDIATYEIGIDVSNSNAPVRILTVFDPTTNAPTRQFFQLNGITPYVSPTSPANIVTPDHLNSLMSGKLTDINNSAQAINITTADAVIALQNI